MRGHQCAVFTCIVTLLIADINGRICSLIPLCAPSEPLSRVLKWAVSLSMVLISFSTRQHRPHSSTGHEISFWQFKLSHASHWNCTRQRVELSFYAFKISALFTTAVQDLSDTRQFLTSGCPLVAFRECCTHFTSSAISWHSVTLF